MPPVIKQLVGRPVTDLRLDPENPRLPEDLVGASQEALVLFFDSRYDLDEIAESMIQKGFFPQEPLLVIDPDGADAEATEQDGEPRVVVEGNRRLATLLLLLDDGVRTSVERTTHWQALAEQVGPEIRELLEIVPTQSYASREEVEDYLGFRHVTGIEQWSAEAKARFVTKMVASGQSFRDAARKIGSRQDAVRRQVITYRALHQATDAGLEVTRAIKFFGVFYRALQTQGIREYVGVPDYREFVEYNPSPVPADRLDRVAELSDWLFGDGNTVRPLFTDSRRVTDLGHILQSPEATNFLKEERDFNGALALSASDETSIHTSLSKARTELVKANGLAFNFAGDEEVLGKAIAVQRVLTAIVGSLQPPAPEEIPQEGVEDAGEAGDASEPGGAGETV